MGTPGACTTQRAGIPARHPNGAWRHNLLFLILRPHSHPHHPRAGSTTEAWWSPPLPCLLPLLFVSQNSRGTVFAHTCAIIAESRVVGFMKHTEKPSKDHKPTGGCRPSHISETSRAPPPALEEPTRSNSEGAKREIPVLKHTALPHKNSNSRCPFDLFSFCFSLEIGERGQELFSASRVYAPSPSFGRWTFWDSSAWLFLQHRGLASPFVFLLPR